MRRALVLVVMATLLGGCSLIIDSGQFLEGTDAGPRPDGGDDRDGGTPPPLARLDEIRDAADAAGGTPRAVSFRVEGVTVTYRRPAIGTDRAGFYLQEDQDGPAIFVVGEPAALVPGNVVNLEVREVALDPSTGERRVTEFANVTVVDTLPEVFDFVQDVTAELSLASDLDEFESELVVAEVELASDFLFGGDGYVVATVSSAAIPADGTLLVRADEGTFLDGPLAAATVGCTLSIGPSPLAGSIGVAVLQVLDFGEALLTCDGGPTLGAAAAVTSTDVELTFDAEIDPATVFDDSFEILSLDSPTALDVVSASVSGTQVQLVTSPQADELYEVRVVGDVRGLDGTPVNAAAVAQFFGVAAACPPSGRLLINEIDYDSPGMDSQTFVELYNGTNAEIELDGLEVVLFNGATQELYGTAVLAGTLGAFDFALVRTVGESVDVPSAGAANFLLEGSDGIQNGPDGVALRAVGTTDILDFVAYEAPFPSDQLLQDSGAPAGTIPPGLNVSVGEDTNDDDFSSLSRLADGCDSGDPALDWAFTRTSTPGESNLITLP